MSDHQKQKYAKDDIQVLTVELPKETMRRIEGFCASERKTIQEFALDALMEKLSLWKE